MAGSISRKARGLRVKVWAKLQFLLTKGGLRVDFWKLQGLFNKNPSRTVTRESRPLDLDLVVQI
jgi:hypothetical protein